MKISTTQDQAYLNECLAFHKSRLAYFQAFDIPPKEKVSYHASQIKWFKAKLASAIFQAEKKEFTPSIQVPQIPLLTEILKIPAERSEAPESVGTIAYDDSALIPESKPEYLEPPAKPASWFTRMVNKLRGV